MAPGTGTPDCAASSIRIRSTRRHGNPVCDWFPLTLLSISIALAGCTSQPLAPDTDTPANANSGHAVPVPSDSGAPPTHETARSGHSQLPVIATRPSVPTDPTDPTNPTAVSVVGHGSSKVPESQFDNVAAGDRDAWARIREAMDLPLSADPRVRRAIAWYRKNPKYLHRLARRARPYLAYIVREVEKRDMPMEFALVPVVESAFRVRAYSRVGASGLWQFMPSTGKRYGLNQNWWYDGRRDVVESTRAALEYLTKLLEEFGGDPLLAVAAYNWGEGNVRRAVARNRARGKPTDVWSLRLPRETQIHVSRLVAIAAIVERPNEYGVVLETIPDRIHFRPVSTGGQINLAFAARLAGISLAELHRLNPGFKRAATAPDGPHRLQLPSDTTERFTAGLAGLPVGKHGRWARHVIVRGDTLGEIAGRYGTSIRALKVTNRLTSDRIIAGSHLMVPIVLGNRDAPRLGATTRTRPDRIVAEGPQKLIHLVRSGDSLWRIAHKHGVEIQQLAAWNDLSIEAVLQPGQKLRLIPAAYTGPQSEPERIRYRVKRGDSLWEISRQFGVSVASLRRWNRISGNETLMPGQELFVHMADTPAI
jgi:membrane-bound lytic murein transglycosylase D